MRFAVGLLAALAVLAATAPASAAGLADRAVAGVVKSGCSPNRQEAPPADSITGQIHDRVMQYALNREMQRELGAERARQLAGDDSGSGMANVQAMIDCANRLFMERMLEASRRNCKFARETGLPTALGLERQNQLLGGGSSRGGVDVMGGTMAALDNCWKEATENCIEPGDNVRMAEAVGIARQGQLMGGDANNYTLEAISICSTTSLPTAASRRIADVAARVGGWFGVGGGT
ncbi:MAG: hypothetical protein IT535_13335 [Bauldia sp.]|nr:hypothetical protein [Bauldia sp.]